MKQTQFLLFYIVFSSLFVFSCKKQNPIPDEVNLISLKSGDKIISPVATNLNISIDGQFSAEFSAEIDAEGIEDCIFLTNEQNDTIFFTINYAVNRKIILLSANEELSPHSNYRFVFSDGLLGVSGEFFNTLSILFTTGNAEVFLTGAVIEDWDLMSEVTIKDIPFNPIIVLDFSRPMAVESVMASTIQLKNKETDAVLEFSFENENKTVVVNVTENLIHLSKYTLSLGSLLQGQSGEQFSGFSKDFYTKLDSTPKFPVISDDALLTLIQNQTFKYFWDFGHPISGMARERNTSGDVVTTGGTGFGIMALIVAIERGFITRSEGLARLETIVTFLENADRFHGAWPHWLNGSTGNTIPFSPNDDGADLVETAFLIQGLLTFRQYLQPSIPEEDDLITRINALWNGVEWNWFTQGQNVLYWHWSPNNDFDMNVQIRGHNETLITYVLAASSASYGITPAVYHQGYAQNGAIMNGNSYYGIQLPLGSAFGGPLFFAHYSFMGLDPTNLSDNYAGYWQQNTNHTLINRAYCQLNPKNFIGYTGGSWGLTASDNPTGYSAHSPTNDLGVITPTAAISSLPYTPDESMEAIHHFYYLVGDKLWGEYGFYDAYNATENWWADSYIAIDQGPIIVMIENYRTGLLWDLFMSCPEITTGLGELGFSY